MLYRADSNIRRIWLRHVCYLAFQQGQPLLSACVATVKFIPFMLRCEIGRTPLELDASLLLQFPLLFTFAKLVELATSSEVALSYCLFSFNALWYLLSDFLQAFKSISSLEISSANLVYLFIFTGRVFIVY